ncbi:MAG: hypothetical protein QW101_00315 [Ignisphaera sp.]|uniref:Uncharacterized protein n=1 Tax=Ignisphaera aggregans TaxID=334771 RepID=A0A7J3N083_9CREN
MENRYIIIGLAIISISSLFIVYGVLISNDRVIGVSLSILVVGVVSTAVGTTYREPLEEMLEHYIHDLNLFYTSVLEDTGIVGSHKIKLCLEDRVIVFSERVIPCSRNISVGVNMLDRVPYIALPITNILDYISKVVGESSDVVDGFRKIFIDTSYLCREVAITKENDTISIELSKLSEKALEMMKTPINIIRVYVLTLLAHHFKNDIEIVDEVITAESYKIIAKILGE